MTVIKSEIPIIGDRNEAGMEIPVSAQLKAIVDEYMMPQLKFMAARIVELTKRVEAAEEKNRTIHVHLDGLTVTPWQVPAIPTQWPNAAANYDPTQTTADGNKIK